MTSATSLLSPEAFLSPLAIGEAVTRALDEDLGRAGDVTSIATIPETTPARAIMVAALALLRPASLSAVGRSWRPSLGAGFFGAAASACWFAALALAPAGPVRAVGVIEAPIAAAAGRRLFKERLSPRQLAGGALAAVGVAVAALG